MGSRRGRQGRASGDGEDGLDLGGGDGEDEIRAWMMRTDLRGRCGWKDVDIVFRFGLDEMRKRKEMMCSNPLKDVKSFLL